MALRIVEEAGLTDVGRQRHTNEDRYFESAPLFAVADGMGGARAGEVASQIAVDEFAAQADGDGSPEERLASIVRTANRKIYDLSQSNESQAGMGTTVTAALVGQQEVSLGHVGDSRAYRFRDDELERLTQDHSLVEELMRMGKLSPEDAESDPRRSIITRALGPEPDVEVETYTYPARDGDVYLICSDGLTGMVPDERMAEILRARSSLAQAAKDLVDDANARGGKDNITVLMFKLGEEADRAAGVESDTLSGAEAASDETVEQPLAQTEADAGGDTVVIGPDEAARARAATPAAPARAEPPPPRRPTPPPRVGRRRPKVVLAVILTAIVVVASLVGLYEAGRQFYFVGTDETGLITLYRGVPYDLPLGVKLYSEEYESTVPAISLPKRQRQHVLDNKLRGKGDAVDLVRSLERTQG